MPRLQGLRKHLERKPPRQRERYPKHRAKSKKGVGRVAIAFSYRHPCDLRALPNGGTLHRRDWTRVQKMKHRDEGDWLKLEQLAEHGWETNRA
jgi:hypothetical protein